MKATAGTMAYKKGLKLDAYNRVHEADDAGKRALLEAALFQLRIAARCLLEGTTEPKPNDATAATLNFVVNMSWGIEDVLKSNNVLLTEVEPEPGPRPCYEPLPHPLEDQDGGDIRRLKP